MSVNVYNLKKWSKMLTGNSILHVNQAIGENYQKDRISGYYNNLTEKVTRLNLEDDELPISSNEKNKAYYFPIAIFQYGLGAYDLFLQSGDKKYLNMVKKTSNWAIDNQGSDGGWSCFFDNNEQNEYSSMGQGEGISLLARIYMETKEKKYLSAIKKAFLCMTRPVDEMGTVMYKNGDVFFKEFANDPVVLNGWIFSIFGLYDYTLLFPEDNKARKIYKATVKTLVDNIYRFDLGYWSKYDIESKIASPFYHVLHINLLDVLYDLTNEKVFKKYADIFRLYNDRETYKMKAFVKKSIQKIAEK